MSSRFWPVAESAQVEYERLRALALAGERCGELLVARRFERRGLAGLISWPQAEPDYLGSVIGVCRLAWCGSDDPREQRLRDAYDLLLADADSNLLRAVGE